MRLSTRCSLFLLTVVLCSPLSLPLAAGEVVFPLDEEGRLVQFERDIVPILQTHCLQCHGPDKQEADFRVDQPDLLFSYVIPGDLESSSLFIDYVTASDETMLMPPPGSSGGPLSVQQLALLRVWIEEGADWPEGVEVVPAAEATSEAVVVDPPPMKSFPARFWAFQGYLHPATVHFPIALLLMGGLFVVLGCKWPPLGTQIPFACLVIGAASSVAATAMGWSFAAQRGHAAIFDPSKEIFWHRWSALLVTLLAVVLAGLALVAVRRQNRMLHQVWKGGLVLVALLVGWVGHQGGELTYGDTFYDRAFEMLRGPQPTLQEAGAEEASGPAAGELADAGE